ncbi:MAG: glycosyltransferase family 39 protein, partial [Candidatus Omnitrophica bacterium]|nr:glycosyltransferase family 39 protein [Candidatus Omnitrophota bacterium]
MNKKINFYLTLIIFIGTFLRILNLSKHSFWCDELLAISLGKHSIKWIIDYITYKDAHPPLYYIFIHYMMKFGENEVFLRSLSLFFGVLSIPFSYILGKKFKNERTGILLSFFISLSPSLILWSQIIKSYTFFTLLTIFSFISLLNLIEQKNKRWIIFFTLINILLLYAHNLSFIVILIEFFTLLTLKKFNFDFFISFLITFLFYIPWLIRIPYQLIFTLGIRRPIPTILRFPYTLFYFFFGETINPFNFKILLPLFIVYLLIFIKNFKKLFLLEKEKKFLMTASLIFPLIFIFFPSTVPQNLIPFSIFWFLLFSLLIENLSVKNILLYFPYLSLIPSLFFYYTDNISQYHDTSKLIPYREIYEEIQEIEIEGDLIITTEKIDKDIFAPIQWYYKGKNQVVGIEKEEDLENIEMILKDKKRIFLTLDFVNSSLLSEKIKEIFEKNYKKILEK